MHSRETIEQAKRLYGIHGSYHKVAAILDLSHTTIQHMVKTDYDRPKLTLGPPRIISRSQQTRIKRVVRSLNAQNHKVTAKKVQDEAQISVA